MRAWVIHEPGGPDRFRLETRAVAVPRAGHVLIAIRGFGLNRSEWFTRRGDSPGVSFPRVLGIECVGEVVDAGGTDVAPGQRVCAMMGGMGRSFDGSYAEFTSVPRSSVFPIDTALPWADFAALPEMLQTVHGSLHTALRIRGTETLLVRGGTSSIGFAAIALARAERVAVTATTRAADREALLREAGADHVIIDDGDIAERARVISGGGFDGVLELVGTTTLADSLRCARPGGVVCMTGILGGAWEWPAFRPMEDLPTAVRLTSYSGNADDITQAELARYVQLVESGALTVRRGPVFPFGELPDAHRLMDRDGAAGKIVVVTD